MKQEELDILKLYLTEDEIKDVVIEQYKAVIYAEIKNIEPSKRLTDGERIISNAIFYYLQDNIDGIVGGNANFKESIKKGVEKCITGHNLSFHIYRRRDPWDKEDSLAYQIMDDCIMQNKGLIADRVKEAILGIRIEDFEERVVDITQELVREMFFNRKKEQQ